MSLTVIRMRSAGRHQDQGQDPDQDPRKQLCQGILVPLIDPAPPIHLGQTLTSVMDKGQRSGQNIILDTPPQDHTIPHNRTILISPLHVVDPNVDPPAPKSSSSKSDE